MSATAPAIRHRFPASKLQPPPAPPGYVARPRLDDALEAAFARRVTLVSAQPGSGKTVLVAAWARAASCPVAWLDVDAQDNTAARLWSLVAAALDHADGMAAAPTLPGRQRGVERILARLDGRERPLVLVIDDVDELRDPAALETLSLLVVRAPATVRIVLAGRADPPLRLQRLRLSGQLAEIRARDLAFTPAECAELLAEHDVELEPAAVAQLVGRTGGWAAAIRLAALSLEGHPDPAHFVDLFAGDDSAVSDYLMSEVLDRQLLDVADFLLRTAVPDELTPELAEQLAGRADAGRLLARLEAANFLVTSTEGPRRTYRYHGLLREFLYAQLRWANEADTAALHAIAAAWHADGDDPASALRHALQARDWPLADGLCTRYWERLLYAAPIPTIPSAALSGLGALTLAAAHAAAARGATADAATLLADAEGSGVDRHASDDDVSALHVAVRLEQCWLRGDVDHVATEAGALLAAAESSPDEARAAARRAAALVFAADVDLARGDLAAAEWRLRLASRLAVSPEHDALLLHARSTTALLEVVRGRARPAAELAEAAIRFADERGLRARPEAADAHVTLAWARLVWDELDAARAAATAAEVAAEGGHRRALATARAIAAAASGRPPRHEAAALRAAADASPHRLGGLRPIPAAASARSLLAAGRARDALAVLPHGSVELPVADRVAALILEAEVRDALHQPDAASHAFEQALALGEPDGYRRPFVEAGSARALLVREVRRGTAHRAYVEELLAVLDHRAAPVDVEQLHLREPLSERELGILRYLPTMMTNAEIASELFLSVNTVKTHLRSIYRKLDTDRRREAVARARRLRLL